MKSTSFDNSDIDGRLPLQAVGQKLKEARAQKGESLAEVSRVTRIGKDYLEALEEGATAKLPSQAYTRGFIRLYSAHLGLSSEDIVSMLNSHTATAGQQAQTDRDSTTHPVMSLRQQSTGSGRTKKIVFSLICAVTLAIIAVTIMTRNKQERPIAQVQSAAVRPTSETVPAASVPILSPAQVNAPPAGAALQNGTGEVVPEDGIILRLKTLSDGRLHITIDGSASQEYFLVAGDLVEWKAEKMFLLDLENAGSVEGELNGSPLKPFGEAGKAAHLIIRQNGVQQD